MKRPKKVHAHIWVILGRQIEAGEHMALERGLPPMTNPSVEDILALTDPIEEAVVAADVAQREFALCLVTLEKFRPKAKALVEDIAENMKRGLRHLNPPRRRRVMRAYGFRFKNDKKTKLLKPLADMVDLTQKG